jgi:hypothetical protein
MFRVGRRYQCAMSIDASGGALTCAWSPEIPTRLSKRELRDYRRGRDALVAELARLMNRSVLIVE